MGEEEEPNELIESQHSSYSGRRAAYELRKSGRRVTLDDLADGIGAA